MERGSCCHRGESTEGQGAQDGEINGKHRERGYETEPRALGVGERRRKARQELCGHGGVSRDGAG